MLNIKFLLGMFQNFRGNRYFYYTYPISLIKRALGFKILLFAEIYFETRCNFRCWHCSSADTLSNTDQGMSFENLQTVTSELKRCGVVSVSFVGGETVIRKELIEIIRMTRQKKILPTIISNGWLLNSEKIDDLFDAGLANLGLSFQSWDAAEHDKMVNKNGAYKRLMSALMYCIDKKYPTSICAVPTNKNIHNGDFQSLIDFAVEHNLRVNINLPAPTGNLSGQDSEILADDSLEILKDQYFKIDNFLPDFKMSFAGLNVWCPMGETSVYIMPDGDVCPCTFTQVSFGNILTEDLKLILKKMRSSKLLSSIDRVGQCPISMNPEFIKKVNKIKSSDRAHYPPRWDEFCRNGHERSKVGE